MNYRKMLFRGMLGSRTALEYLPTEIAERMEVEARLLDCYRCNDETCVFRFKDERFPEDAGGRSQCLRWAQKHTPLAWRNQDGRVIIMPQEVIDKLKAIL